ncbi:thioesterase family protein [Phenylobacterium sp.]|uniref:thioesterase family protein n=1 Tax=Phenylobacterium sp. TaxID=1871053 RepID=UPI0035AEE384
MSEAVFVVDGPTARATARAAGPWNPGLMHGGAPSALIAWAAEQVETPAPMQVARLTIDLLRPVPVGALTVETEVLRQGRKIQLVQVRLLAGGVEVTRGAVLKVRRAELDLPAEVGAPALDHPRPEDLPEPPPFNGPNAFGSCFEIRSAFGGFGHLGPSASWFRVTAPMIAGQANSPAMRAAAIADFTNGISSVLPFERWTYINGDLTVSLSRPPQGEWILSNAESWISPEGVGLATTRLADVCGYFGRAVQTLVVEAR